MAVKTAKPSLKQAAIDALEKVSKGKIIKAVKMPASAGPEQLAGIVENRSIPIEQLVPSPTNPRKTFDQVALQSLADSINSVGMAQPPLVRSKFAGSFEIVAGERRYRAAKLAGWTHIACTVRELTDAQVLEIQLVENLQREDLNPIEEAESFLALTTTGGYTQTALAVKLGVTQGHIANRIRLLELPEAWRGKIISQEMPLTHARAMLPYAGYPTVLKAIEREFAAARKNCDEGQDVTVEEFTRVMGRAFQSAGRNMELHSWPRPEFKASDEQLEKLQVVEGPTTYGGKAKMALNVKLYDELQHKAAAERQKESSHRMKAEETKAKAKKAKAPTQSDQEFGRALNRYREDWMIERIKERLGDPTDQAATMGAVVTLLVYGSSAVPDQQLQATFGLGRKGKIADRREIILRICEMQVDDLIACAADFLKRAMTDGNGKPDHPFIDPVDDELDALALGLGISVEADWEPDDRFLALWQLNRLQQLAESGPFPPECALCQTARLMGDLMLQAWPKDFVPRELITADISGNFEPTKSGKSSKPPKKGK